MQNVLPDYSKMMVNNHHTSQYFTHPFSPALTTISQQPKPNTQFFKFKRNSYHLAIAYTTYTKSQGPDINENQDPTSIRRKYNKDGSQNQKKVSIPKIHSLRKRKSSQTCTLRT